jgi:TRAP-type C4-dicarboxylate transport system permease small subunit
MDLLVQKVGPQSRKVLEILSSLLVLVFLGCWGVFGWTLVVQNLDYLAPSTEIPMGYVYVVGPLSALLMAGLYVAKLVRALRTPAAG